MGLYTPTILGGNSYLSWFYDRGALKGPPHTGTSEGLSQAINRRPIGNFLPNCANVYVTIQSHGFSADARTHYVTADGVRNGLCKRQPAQWSQSFLYLLLYFLFARIFLSGRVVKIRPLGVAIFKVASKKGGDGL